MKLTIAFPTYNRSGYLRRALESVLGQLADVPRGVSVTLRVYDNASTDDTPAVCAELAARDPRLEVVRHADNIGGDANILAGLKGGEGDYVWVFGDDDYLRAGTLGRIAGLLATREFAVLKLGSQEERDGRGGVDATIPPPVAGLAGELTVERFDAPAAILERFGMGMGNFSSVVFARDFFRANQRDVEPEFFRSGYSQLQWIYGGLHGQPRRFGFVADPVLVLRIEMSPREVSADRVAYGLGVLRRNLVEIGYPAPSVERFFVRQNDAILLGRVKAGKMAGRAVLRELPRALAGLSDLRGRLKMLVIAAMPARLYRTLWARL